MASQQGLLIVDGAQVMGRNDWTFSSLFPIKGSKTDAAFKSAIELFEIEDLLVSHDVGWLQEGSLDLQGSIFCLFCHKISIVRKWQIIILTRTSAHYACLVLAPMEAW